jgi:hypothetical protein
MYGASYESPSLMEGPTINLGPSSREMIYRGILVGLVILVCILLIRRSTTEGFESSYVLPKTIWIYWDSPEQPKLISDIIEHNKTVLQGWTINVLNKNTVIDFIDPLDIPNNFTNYSNQHQSDWFRLTLLHIYGGCWLDASIIVNSNEALEHLRNESIQKKSQFTGFSWHSADDNRFQHPSGTSFPFVIENWFMMAPKNGSLITDFLNEYERALDMSFVKYKKDILQKGIRVDSIYDKNDPEDVYLTQHTCIQKVLQTRKTLPPMIISKAEDSMFKIRVECNMDCNCIMNKIKDDPANVSRIPYIKLVSCDRDTKVDISNYFKQIWSE